MKYGEFMMHLKKDGLRHLYLLAGEEHYYIEKALETLLGKLFQTVQERQDGLQRFQGDADPAVLAGSIEQAPFFAPQNVILVQDVPWFRSSKKGGEGKEAEEKDKRLAALMQVLSDMPPYSYIIFVVNYHVDKRRKLTKLVEKHGQFLEAEPLRPWTIQEWLQGKLQSLNKEMDRDAYAYFAGAVSMMQQISLSYLDKEFDKLALFSREPRITKAELMEVFAGIPEVSVFSLLDAISARDAGKALLILHRQLADGIYFTVILSLLTRHVRQLWQARALQQQGVRGKALAKPLELNPFIAERLGRAAMKFPEAVLKKAMLQLIDADYYLKTGQAGEEVLEEAVIGLCCGQAD
ncbi:DNA polymerase III subunit delta [Mitsuokella jalaludinii]|uniref:DNA polymerase III subunit delta n=1 Tax=Mitsuokella jalaludinii TaxID=187979 RepID=UPI003F98FEA3